MAYTWYYNPENVTGSVGLSSNGQTDDLPTEHGFLFEAADIVQHNSSNFIPDDIEYSFDDIPYPGTIKKLPAWELVIKILFSALVILASLVGNILVIVIVWRNRRLRTTTNYYIVNLAVADLLVTCMCSWVHVTHDVTEGWILGAFFCKLNSFGQVLALVSSILTLTLIACDRFFGIVFAMRAHLTERRATTCILLVWACAVGVASPLLVFRSQSVRQWADHTEVWCEDTWPQEVVKDSDNLVVTVTTKTRTVYFTVVSVLLFFLPIIVMTTAYSFIVWRLWSSDMPGEHLEAGKVAQERMKKKVAVMLMVLLFIFVVCWLPLQASLLYSEYRQNKHESLPSWYPVFTYIATFIAYSNSAFNPIIYAGFNENFRKGFKNLFHLSSKSDTRHYSSMMTSTSYIRRDSFRGRMMTNLGTKHIKPLS